MNPLRTSILSIAILFAIGGCDGTNPLTLRPNTATSPFSDPQPALGSTPFDAAELNDAVVKAVNAERTKVGLPPVIASDSLYDIADAYAMRLISKDFFAHVDPATGSTVARRAINGGYAFFKVGENLAAGQKTIASVMKNWMESPAHRANILDPDFTEIGVAVRDGGRYGRYWVQEFGRPLGQ